MDREMLNINANLVKEADVNVNRKMVHSYYRKVVHI